MRIALVFGVLVLFHASAARAQDPAPKDSTVGIVDFGYVQTSGNTDVQTLTGRERIEHYTGFWKFAEEATAVQGETKGVETTARYTALLRAGYDFSERVGGYLLTTWRREPYAGLTSQFDEGVGLTFHAVRPSPHELDFEAGVGMLQREFTSGIDEDFATGRVGMAYRYHFTEKALVSARGDYVVDLEDSGNADLHGVFGVVAPLTAGISMRAGYDIYHRSRPAPGFEKTDTTFDTGIQLRF